MPLRPFAAFALIFPAMVVAQSQDDGHSPQPSPYVGQETRAIKSLSQDDLDEIADGGGWGLARAAELNGVPGPTHLLELEVEIGLSEDQSAAVEAIRAQMQADAISAGARFVQAEQALDLAFRTGVPNPEQLESLIMAAGQARAELRLVHLNAHLETLPLLSDVQVKQYSRLRGYADDPCTAIPDGHDADLWRQHNGCG